jgi:hypothetical protein
MFELITEVGGFDGLLDSTDDLGTGNLLMTDDSGRAACTCVLFIKVVGLAGGGAVLCVDGSVRVGGETTFFID